MQKFIQTLEQARYDASGWSIGTDPQSLDYFTRQLHALIIRDLCANGYDPCITDAVAHYRQWRENPNADPIAPDIRTVAYCQGIKNGTAEDYEHMRELYKQTNDQVEKNRFGYALTCTQNITLLEQLLNTTLANDYIRLQDASRFINNIRLQPGGQKLTWRFISQQWTELVAKFGGYYQGKHHPDDPNYWGPEFNYEFHDEQLDVSPAVVYMKDVVRYWVGEFHLDGIRFDAAKQMDTFNILHELDRVARTAVRTNQPFYTTAEFVPENLYITKAKNGPVDACWTQALYGNLENALTDKVDLNDMKYAIANNNVVNYTDCHDNKRLLFRVGNNHCIFDDEAFLRMHMAAILLATSVGVPLIWQGDELGDASSFEETDENKTTNHYDMHWDLLNQDRNRWHIRKIILLLYIGQTLMKYSHS
ncbi:unnamed protein product [Rotaria sordida]|uniref:Glycosyl hydrolase family 13 catalytic domain-containing protein n=1 Tax=Rotaria sordida TaxID=392033 RepID=A0A813VX44_9BILA|nr:unnamed protein product [Rotaria sordida]